MGLLLAGAYDGGVLDRLLDDERVYGIDKI